MHTRCRNRIIGSSESSSEEFDVLFFSILGVTLPAHLECLRVTGAKSFPDERVIDVVLVRGGVTVVLVAFVRVDIDRAFTNTRAVPTQAQIRMTRMHPCSHQIP